MIVTAFGHVWAALLPVDHIAVYLVFMVSGVVISTIDRYVLWSLVEAPITDHARNFLRRQNAKNT